MAEQIETVNVALTMLGEARIVSMLDNSKPAREANAIYDVAFEAFLGAHSWSFAKARTTLPALSDPPAFEYAYQYQLPPKALRLVYVGNVYSGVDLSSVRNSPSAGYVIEGRRILTNMGAPLPIKYISKVEDISAAPGVFAKCFACYLAEMLAEPLTQSEQKRARAEAALRTALREAVTANAIELPPNKLPDDEWMLSRL